MLGSIKYITGNVTVEERESDILIEGVNFIIFDKILQKVVKTSIVAKYLFLTKTRYSATLHRFYAMELMHTLEMLINSKQAPMSLVRVCNKLKIELLENTWLKTLESEHNARSRTVEWRNKFYKTPLDYQDKFIHEYNNNTMRMGLKGYLLAAEPGTGKTLSSLFLSESKESDLVVVICPKNAVKRVWDKTLKEDFKNVPVSWNSIDGGKVDRRTTHLIAHYEQISEVAKEAIRLQRRRVTVILDECHNLNNIKAQRTQNFIQMCKQLNTVAILWMSGTPIKAMGSEMVPFLLSIDPLFEPPVIESFLRIFTKSSEVASVILARRLGMLMYKVSKKATERLEPNTYELKVKIPNDERYTLVKLREEMRSFVEERLHYYKLNEKRYLDMYRTGLSRFLMASRTNANDVEFVKYKRSAEQVRHTQMYSDFKEEIMFCNQYEKNVIMPHLSGHTKEAFREAKSIYKYVELSIRGQCLGRVLGKRREECHSDMVPHIGLPEIINGSIKKTIVFTSFVETLKVADEYLKSEGFNPVVVYGATNSELPKLIKHFETVENANPIIATFQSLSTAVPLVMANTAILLNAPFRPHEYEQATARVDRLGQDTQVDIFNVHLDTGGVDNISTRSKDIMNWCQDQIDLLMGVKTAGVENHHFDLTPCTLPSSADW